MSLPARHFAVRAQHAGELAHHVHGQAHDAALVDERALERRVTKDSAREIGSGLELADRAGEIALGPLEGAEVEARGRNVRCIAGGFGRGDRVVVGDARLGRAARALVRNRER